jgi:hypothetical protein
MICEFLTTVITHCHLPQQHCTTAPLPPATCHCHTNTAPLHHCHPLPLPPPCHLPLPHPHRATATATPPTAPLPPPATATATATPATATQPPLHRARRLGPRHCHAATASHTRRHTHAVCVGAQGSRGPGPAGRARCVSAAVWQRVAVWQCG